MTDANSTSSRPGRAAGGRRLSRLVRAARRRLAAVAPACLALAAPLLFAGILSAEAPRNGVPTKAAKTPASKTDRPAAETARNPLDDLKHWVDRHAASREIAERTRDSESVRGAYRDVVKQARQSTVKVLADDLPVAFGVVVSAEGFVATKASELRGELKCVLGEGGAKRALPAKIAVVRKEHDLALLRLESADDLAAIDWSDAAPRVGDFLATSGTGELPAAIGVVSVVPRRIAPAIGFLGVGLDDARPRVIHIQPGSGADKAGLQIDDLVLSVDGQKIESREALQRQIRQHEPGARVELQVRRGEHEFKVSATLGDPQLGLQPDRVDFQNRLGGSLSGRRAGFESVFQHDTILHPNECGGPLVDLDGRAIGINIARAGRVATYAIPASVARGLVAQMIAESSREANVAERPMRDSSANPNRSGG